MRNGARVKSMTLRFFPGLLNRRFPNRPSAQPALRSLGRSCCALGLSLLLAVPPVAAQSAPGASDAAAPTAKSTVRKGGAATAKPAAKTATKTAPKTASGHHRRRPQASRAERTARTARIKQVFVASTELRPMAQQLAL